MEVLDLSDFITTKGEANDFLARLTAISDKLYQTEFNLKKAITEQFGVAKSDRFLTLLRDNNINAETLPAVKDFLQKIQEQVSKLPVIAIAMAFEPSEQTLKDLSEWFLVNMKKQMIFDITVDHSLVAGATITYNGKFTDFSIRPTFQRILQDTVNRMVQINEASQKMPPSEQNLHQRAEDISLGR